MNLDELLEDRDRLANRLTVPVLMSTDHAEACARARKEVDRAQKALARAERLKGERLSHPDHERAKQELQEAQDAVQAADEAAAEKVVEFVVESVGADLWEEIVDAHPPTQQQQDQHGDLWFNPSTFPLIAIGLCLVEPEVPRGQLDRYLEQMRDGFPDGPPKIPSVGKLRGAVPDIVWQQLLTAVIRVNRGANAVPKSLSGSGATRSSASGSGPPSS